VGVGNSVFKGTFKIQTWVEKGTGEPLLIPEDEENDNDNN